MNKTRKSINYLSIFLLSILFSILISKKEINSIININKELFEIKKYEDKVDNLNKENELLIQNINDIKVELYNVKDFEDNKKAYENELNNNKNELEIIINKINSITKEINELSSKNELIKETLKE